MIIIKNNNILNKYRVGSGLEERVFLYNSSLDTLSTRLKKIAFSLLLLLVLIIIIVLF